MTSLAILLTSTGLALVLVPWVLYPAAVALLARLAAPRPAPRPPGGAWPSVTCVLATRDDPATVRARIIDFLAQDYPPDRLDVVVAVDAVAAPTLLPGLEFDDPRVRVLVGDPPGGKGPALNAAVRAAGGDVLLFSDARQRFAPDVARKLAAALTGDRRLGITSGRLILPRDDASSIFQLYSRYELDLRDAEAQLHSAVGVSGSVYAMWRALWAPLPAGLILDDVYVPMRLALLGRRVGFVRDAHAYETRRVGAVQEFRRKVRTLTGNYQLCAWLPGVLLPWRNPIWLQFVLHKLLRLLLPFAVLLTGVGLAMSAWLAAGTRAPWLLVPVVLMTGWCALGRDNAARRVRGVAVQFASMQAAAGLAFVYGVRGRWDVWRA